MDFAEVGEFFQLVELHWEGSVSSLRIRLVYNWLGYILPFGVGGAVSTYWKRLVAVHKLCQRLKRWGCGKIMILADKKGGIWQILTLADI